jgi:hypothetical protein
MNAELRITSEQEMDMIGHHFHFNTFLPPFLHGLQENRFQTFIYSIHQHVAPIFGTKYHMIMTMIRYVVMCSQFIFHAGMIPHKQ